MTIIQTLKPLLLPFAPKLARNEEDTLARNSGRTTVVTRHTANDSQIEQDVSKQRTSFWKSGYSHLTSSIVARYTPATIVPIPISEDRHDH
ncbi:hypothetical protein [Paenibacillus kandeliae]|uniref:hypothetical protein n=1 Tax=Paenibacillus kandeliae TaxID=3231269 RepID=UPI0034582C5F